MMAVRARKHRIEAFQKGAAVTGPAGIKDVAERARVSVGTVSNVLNRPHLVRAVTRARVEAAIVELGFVRNDSARQLRAGSSRVISYVFLDASNPFFTDVARSAEEASRESGLALMMCNSNGEAAREAEYLDLLLQQRVHGVLITAVDETSPLLRTLPARGVPVVLVDRRASDVPDWCSVGVDDVRGGEIAVTHLLERGHERIAFVGGPLAIPQVADRHEGALRAMAGASRATEDLVVLSTDSLTIAAGREAGQRLAGRPSDQRPTAAFCANDLVALGLLQQLMHLGITVPDDVAIVGYDDIEFASAAAVPLTSVRQPTSLLGRTAAELVLDEARREPDHTHRQVQFTPELIVRESSVGRSAATSPRARTPADGRVGATVRRAASR
jgi:LacI family transcriptional regulator